MAIAGRVWRARASAWSALGAAFSKLAPARCARSPFMGTRVPVCHVDVVPVGCVLVELHTKLGHADRVRLCRVSLGMQLASFLRKLQSVCCNTGRVFRLASGLSDHTQTTPH